MSHGFPTFPCSEACGRNVGVKGNKCQHCKDKANFGRRPDPIPQEIQAERYVASKEATRARMSRRAGRSL
jgi:hypothetical protein